MIEIGSNSQEDPRVPEINIKHGFDAIASGSEFVINNVSKDSASSEFIFTIENLGTADLRLSGTLPVIKTNDGNNEFTLKQPTSGIIPAGENSTFIITYTPRSADSKNITLNIPSNDFDEENYEITITGKPQPIADFNARIRKGTPSFDVTFEDRSLGNITSWHWDFNADGTVDSMEQNPTHTFTRSGSYTVMLTVAGDGGQHIKVKTNYITVAMPIVKTVEVTLTDPAQICLADIDNDGDIDMVSSDCDGDDKIFWYENDGIGNYTPHLIGGYYNYARALFIKDIDKDGNQDVVMGSGSEIRWFRNDGTPGDGTWSNYQIIPQSNCYSVFAADIDGDSHIDIAAVSADNSGNTNELFWIENDGTPIDGGWIKNSLNTSMNFPCSVFIADIDGDNDQDIAVAARNDNAIYWYYNDKTFKDGTTIFSHNFKSPKGIIEVANRRTVDTDFGGPVSIYIHDVDKDGDMDILGAGETGNEIALWNNMNSIGTEWKKTVIEADFTGANDVFPFDINKDGHVDIVASAEIDKEISWWQNDGKLNFKKHTVAEYLDFLFSVASSDLNGDGHPDIAAAANDLSWWAVTQDWFKQVVDNHGDGKNSITAADIDGDGNRDILGAGNVAAWWKNDGSGNFPEGSRVKIQNSTTGHITAADIDNDGDMDVLTAGNIGNEIIFWENSNGKGTEWNSYSINTGNFHKVSALNVIDMDNDGDLDIAASFNGDIVDSVSIPGGIAWWENNTGSTDWKDNWTPHTVDADFDQAQSLHTADIDGDGDIDALAGNLDGGLSLWMNPSIGTNSTWQENVISNSVSFQGINSVFAIDLDNDNDVDLVAASQFDDKIFWWENDGTSEPSFLMHEIDASFDGGRSLYVADLDGDGDKDIVCAGYSGGELSWWENNIGTLPLWHDDWTKHVLTFEFDFPVSVFVSDIDNDDDPDIIASSSSLNGEILLWENNMPEYGN